MTGAPEDVILSGGIAHGVRGTADSLSSGGAQLPLAHRRPRDGGGPRAGLRAAMAGAVLEREGYGLVGGARDCREPVADGVRSRMAPVRRMAAEMSGDTFRSLAAHFAADAE